MINLVEFRIYEKENKTKYKDTLVKNTMCLIDSDRLFSDIILDQLQDLNPENKTFYIQFITDSEEYYPSVKVSNMKIIDALY